MAKTTINEAALRTLAEQTSDAYSFDRYGARGWMACCRMLARRGYSLIEIEAILRSKWTRWAGDGSNNRYGRVNSADLARFLDNPINKVTQEQVDELVAGTL